jgi:ATP-dependent DNA ligase
MATYWGAIRRKRRSRCARARGGDKELARIKSPAEAGLVQGELWLHEIKHDGFRVIARKDGKQVRLYSRPGNDLTYRFPLERIPVTFEHSRHGGRSSGILAG